MPRTSSSDQKVVEKQKRLNREWLVKPGTERMKADDLRFIEEHLENDEPAARLNIADSLSRLASWHGAAGQIAVLRGRSDGWVEIHRSWLHLSLALRIRMAVFHKGKVLVQFRPLHGLESEASLSALCLAWALVLDRKFEIEFFGDSLRAMLANNAMVRADYWTYHWLEPFAVWLHGLSKQEVSKPTRNLGPYQAVLDAWDKPSALAKGIYDVCREHCSRIEDKSDDFTAEFRHPPFDLIPPEVLAIYAVRQRFGLETPDVEHPLLQPSFNSPIGDPSEIQDPLLDRVEARL